MSITNLTPFTAAAPDPSDEPNFNQNAVDSVAGIKLAVNELIVSIPQINDALDQIDDAEAIAELSMALSNFQGNWSSLTGAANKPFSVKHSDAFWALNTNAADITTITPGVSGSWTKVTFGLSGIETLTPAVAATLATDKLISLIAPSVTGLGMLMGAATVYEAGRLSKIVKNNGTRSCMINTNGGAKILAEVKPQHTALIFCVTNSDADGTWIVMNVPPGLTRSFPQVYESAQTQYMSGCAIGPNKFLLVYEDTGNSAYFTGVVVTEANGVLTVGTPQVLQSTAVAAATACCGTGTDDEAIAIFVDTGGAVDFLFLTVSGSVITVANDTNVIASSVNTSYGIGLCRASEDKFVIALCYTTEYGNYLVVNTSGTAYSSKGSVTLINGNVVGRHHRLVNLGTNKVAVVSDDGAGAGRVQVGDVSGNTITFGSALSVSTQSGGNGFLRIAKFSNSAICVAYANAVATLAFSAVSFYTISGTALTLVSKSQFEASPETPVLYPQLAQITDGLVLMYSQYNSSAAELRYRILSMDDSGNTDVLLTKDFTFMPTAPANSSSLNQDMFEFKDGVVIHAHNLSNAYGAFTMLLADIL